MCRSPMFPNSVKTDKHSWLEMERKLVYQKGDASRRKLIDIFIFDVPKGNKGCDDELKQQ